MCSQVILLFSFIRISELLKALENNPFETKNKIEWNNFARNVSSYNFGINIHFEIKKIIPLIRILIVNEGVVEPG